MVYTEVEEEVQIVQPLIRPPVIVHTSFTPGPSYTSSTPPPLRREPSVIFPKHYTNPNFVERPPPEPVFPARPVERTGTPNTWVTTEPADDQVPIKVEPAQEETVDEGLIPAGSPGPPSIASSGSSSGSRLRRAFTSLLTNSRPVASLFSVPRNQVNIVTNAARENGLYTGLVEKPRKPRTEVKVEEVPAAAAPRRARALGRERSWWVIMGSDAEAVMHLQDLQDKNALARDNSQSPEPELVAVESPGFDRPAHAAPWLVNVLLIIREFREILLMVGRFFFVLLIGGVIVFCWLAQRPQRPVDW